MDADTDIHSASRRLNATLVSKGLLNDTAQLKFHEGSDGRKIINFVYEILQRRDKDAEAKENLVHALRENKSTETRYKKTIAQLETKMESLERQLNIVAVQRDNFKTNIKTLEVHNRTLQDDIARQKTMLQQIRAQDSNERRKRDQQILRMKEKAGFDIRRPRVSSSISGKLRSSYSQAEDSGSEIIRLNYSESAASIGSFKEQAENVIPEVIQELTDENARLTALIRETALTLNIFTGEKAVNEEEFDKVLQYLPSSFPELSIEVNNSLESLREILHEPKYVTIDEVEKRELEILRLQGQLETMTTKWKEAIETMDEWNQYMAGKIQAPPVVDTKNAQRIPNQARDDHPGSSHAADGLTLEAASQTQTSIIAPVAHTEMKDNGAVRATDKENLAPKIESPRQDHPVQTRLPAVSKIPSLKLKNASNSADGVHYPWKLLSGIKNKSAEAEQKAKLAVEQPISADPPATVQKTIENEKTRANDVTPKGNTNFAPASKWDQNGQEAVDNEDPVTSIVRQIMSDAGLTPRRQPLKTVNQALPRTLFQMPSSPDVGLSPIKLSSIVPGSTPRPTRMAKRHRFEETDDETEFADFSPVKLSKRFKFDE